MTKRRPVSIWIIISTFLCMYRPLKMGREIIGFKASNYPIIISNYLFIAIIIIVSIYFLYKLNIKGMIPELGLNKGFAKGLLFGLIATLPMTVSSAILFKFSNNTFFYILFSVFIAPFMEEVLFRGYLFGMLFKKEQWGFIPASFIAAVLFGIGHLYQAHNLSGAAGTFLVTFVGSAWFCWLYTEFENNLWIPIWLHVLMNMSWTVYQTNVPGAVGSNITNLFRLITIIITVVYTLRYSRKHGRKINKGNLLVNITT